MKCLQIDYDYYLYPDGVSNLADFMSFLNNGKENFILLKKLVTDNCVYPYFIEEEIRPVCLNKIAVTEITEPADDIEIMSNAVYEQRLTEVVRKRCVHCVSYTEDSVGDNLRGHRDRISLDGKCYGFSQADQVVEIDS